MIKFCPNCGSKLVINNPDLSQGCKNCPKCKGVYFIIETTEPKLTDFDITSLKITEKLVSQKLQIFSTKIEKLQNLKNE